MFRLVEGGELLPQRATQHSAGFDVFANEDVVIVAGETVTIGLGIALDHESEWLINYPPYNITLENLNAGFYLELHPRSSLRAKGIGGGVGIIDMDYREEIKIVLSNPIVWSCEAESKGGRHEFEGVDRSVSYVINSGDKIGQLILKRHEGYLLPTQYTLDAERTGGFGSTDV